MTKKINLKLLLICALIFNMFAITANAQESVAGGTFNDYLIDKSNIEESEEVLDQYLLDSGIPEEKISTIPLSAKQTIYSSKAKFLSVKSDRGFLGESNGYSKNLTSSITPMSLENWSADLYTMIAPSNVSGTVNIMLFYNWTWNLNPNYRYTDQFGIAWTDGFHAMTNIAQYEYTQSGTNLFGNTCSRTVSGYGYETYEPGVGIGWEIDLSDSEAGCQLNRHSGYGIVTVTKTHDNSDRLEVSSAVGTYYHQYIKINGNLSFSNAPSVDITWSYAYDKASDTGSGPIYWRHRDY